jgi:hypothetical protein
MNSREERELEIERRKILQENLITENKKRKFIEEIKNGLGEEILKEPNKIYKKPTLWKKIKNVLGWN